MIIVESKETVRFCNIPVSVDFYPRNFYVRILNTAGNCMWDGWIENEWDSADVLKSKIKKALKGEIDLYLTERIEDPEDED